MNAMPMTATVDADLQDPEMIQASAKNDAALAPGRRIILCRFGNVEIGDDNIILFSRGLLGFEGRSEYAVLNLPTDKSDQFKFLQSLSDPALGFIVTEVSVVADVIDPSDLLEAYKQCDAEPSDALTLLIVSVRRGEAGIEMSANLRAPIIISVSQRSGRQHVMSNGRYPIRHPL